MTKGGLNEKGLGTQDSLAVMLVEQHTAGAYQNKQSQENMSNSFQNKNFVQINAIALNNQALVRFKCHIYQVIRGDYAKELVLLIDDGDSVE